MKSLSTWVSLSLIVACLLVTMPPVPAAGADDTATTTVAARTVKLIVDYGDGVEKHFTSIAWRDAMTVQDVTIAATKVARGIQIKQRGRKATAFLSQIDDLANQATGKSWIYRVNGKLADRSFGVHAVAAGDVITWSFEDFP